MRRALLIVSLICLHSVVKGQTNMLLSDPIAEQVLLGNYAPATYAASVVVTGPDSISAGIRSAVSADSLHAIFNALNAFQNRNSGSDTVSNSNGIGAARRWAYTRFQQISAANGGRLLTAYLQFDYNMCSLLQHKNVLAILPGSDTSDKAVIIIEAHLDSRCTDVCDTACLAQGMDDNGSGTALVLELARVMTRFTYHHTIVFMLTTGEEQGLYGATAMANYALNKGIKIKAVLNNDVVGGIICGQTSSAPGCPGLDIIDSTDVRLFSYGGFNSFHKGLCRYIKLEYKERVLPYAVVPMGINIMTPEDRTGRGGDHQPFRSLNYTAMRFTEANENGDANVTDPNYIDRQHTSRDILGLATHGSAIDSFFVDFDYLARNAVINGNAAGVMAISPATPNFTCTTSTPDLLNINITKAVAGPFYKVGVRTTTNDWDSVYTVPVASNFSIAMPPANYAVSIASVDNNGVESIFSGELMTKVGLPEVTGSDNEVELLQNSPNPTDNATMIAIQCDKDLGNAEAYISIRDINGREVKNLPLKLHQGINEVMYDHGYHVSGIYVYSLFINDQMVGTKRMVFKR